MSSRTTPKKISDENSENVPTPKGKGKAVEVPEPEDVEMDGEEEEDEEDDDEEEEIGDEEEDEEEEEDGMNEIDLNNIVSGGRRTRGKRVDYTSKEALEKAGLKDNEEDEEDADLKL